MPREHIKMSTGLRMLLRKLFGHHLLPRSGGQLEPAPSTTVPLECGQLCTRPQYY